VWYHRHMNPYLTIFVCVLISCVVSLFFHTEEMQKDKSQAHTQTVGYATV